MHQQETVMDNPNPSHEERPGAIIKYPLTPPTITETETSTRTTIRPINLEEDTGEHSDDDEFHDSITQMEPDDVKLSGPGPAGVEIPRMPRHRFRQAPNR